jgi:uncharacterized membrane protein YgdD (TMEM256/DUF423 family)
MWTAMAGILGFTAVTLGAFGAHALKERLGTYLPAWQTAVLYHLVHAVAVLALALYARATQQNVNVPAALFTAGIVLFSGSLYALSLTGLKVFGPITPVGGLCFLAGWAMLAWRLRGG